MKKLLAMLVFVLGLSLPAFAGYAGMDVGSYTGSKMVNFSVAVTTYTTAALFAPATYTSVFSTLDDVEFVIAGSSSVYISSATACVTGTAAAPNGGVRMMAVGEKYRTNGRNVAPIYGRCEASTGGTAIFTGTAWGH